MENWKNEGIIATESMIKRFECVFRTAWDQPALSNFGTSLTYTYGDVATRIAYYHILFKEMGLKPGDKIALCDKNSANWALTMLAITTYHAVSVPLLPDFSEKQIASLCEHSEAKVLVCGKKLIGVLSLCDCNMQLLDIDVVPTLDEKLYEAETDKDLAEVLIRALHVYHKTYPAGLQKEDVQYEAENPEDLMLLSYTSGSTGNPKGVMLPFRSIWSNNTFAIEKLPIYDNSRYFVVLPMAHMFGFSFDFLFSVCKASHATILTKAPVPKVLLEAFKTVRPHVFLCVPLVMEKIINGKVRPVLEKPLMKCLLKVPGIRQVILSKVRKQLIEALGGEVYEVIMGGAALSKEVENILRMVKFPYTVGYGMTESGPLLSYVDWHNTRFGSCGQAVDRVEMKVLSSDQENVPGEIVVRGMNVMTGYYKNPEATAEAIDEEGWLHTGDLGVIDRDGFLYIRGRKKNMLLSSNGQNIYPEEIEDQMVSHSVFDECVVVQRNAKLVALVYANDLTLQSLGQTRDSLDLEAIRAEVNRTLPKYCQIAEIEQRAEEFEKTPKKSIRRFLYQ